MVRQLEIGHCSECKYFTCDEGDCGTCSLLRGRLVYAEGTPDDCPLPKTGGTKLIEAQREMIDFLASVAGRSWLEFPDAKERYAELCKKIKEAEGENKGK